MSKKTYTIEVTQEDIEQGTPDNCGKCPIALAARRVLPFAPSVDGEAIMRNRRVKNIWFRWFKCSNIKDPKYLLSQQEACELPPMAKRFVRRFDKGEVVVPFSFQVEVNPR